MAKPTAKQMMSVRMSLGKPEPEGQRGNTEVMPRMQRPRLPEKLPLSSIKAMKPKIVAVVEQEVQDRRPHQSFVVMIIGIERMELKQELEWNEAQNIEISVDLVAAAKRQLQFLATVDRNRYLYDGPALERAIYRYNACWLPLLVKHSESQISEGPLVVPLDCEWVWHCHRLNPVSRPHMSNDHFLEGAVARYKGFLHLLKRNKEKFIRRFCVPTYDIDLIWHTHQLHPVDYCKDLSEVLGKVLEHDDMDSDRTKGKKLDVGFSGTTKQWEETFGRRYWRAGAMHRGRAPSPLTTTPCLSDMTGKEVVASDEFQELIQLPQLKVVEVLLEFVGVKNLPEGHKGSPFVSFCKKQPDSIFKANRNLSIFSESGEKQVASFQCEPTGELLFELKSHSTSNLPLKRAPKVLGSTSLFLQDYLAPVSELSVEKWLELVPSSSSVISKPIGLRVAVSFTVPSPAPHVLRMVCSQLFPKGSCFFPLPGRVRHAKSIVHVIDETGAELLSLQMRDSRKDKEKENCILSKEVIGIMASGETRTLADFVGTGWFLMDSHWSLHFRKNSSHDGHLFELSGNIMVKFFPGRKLGYEPNHCEKHRSEKDFMTAVEFSMENPYGKEVALLDLKSGIFNVKEEWMVVPGITAAFILADVFKKGGYDGFAVNLKNLEMESLGEEVNVDINAAISENGNLSGGGCGGKCGSSCGNALKIFGNGNLSGGKCGSSCGNALKSGGCCGSGCRNMVKSGGCGNMVTSGGCGGCGGSFENISKSGGSCGGCGTKSDHSCAEEHSKEATFYSSKAVAV